MAPKSLALQSSGFPVGLKKILVRQCYVDLADMMLKHFEASGHVIILNGNPGKYCLALMLQIENGAFVGQIYCLQ